MTSYNPPRENVPIFDSGLFTDTENSGGLTRAEADSLYVQYPFAQGPVTFQGQNNTVLPTCSATQPVSTDSSTIMPTTAWVQSAITTGGGGVISIQPLVTDTNITFPVGTKFATIMLVGAGGASGNFYYDGSSTTAGGAGGAGGAIIYTRVPMEASTPMNCTFSGGNVTLNYLPIPNTNLSGTTTEIGTALAGGAGVNGSAGVPNPAGGGGGIFSQKILLSMGQSGSAGGAGQTYGGGTFLVPRAINYLTQYNQNLQLSTSVPPFNYGAGGFSRIDNASGGVVTVNPAGSACCLVISYSS
jgi:hypothetical protein